MSNGLRVLSLFDGISCGMVALERAGIPVERYVAYEIDKYAIKVSEKNYPQIEHMGDVVGADFSQYKGFDLLIGGSPCQGFSFAGKRMNFDDHRSKLFFEFVRALNVIKPKYFLLENVKMKKEWLRVISDFVGVEPILINSNLVSAQNRERYYWTNIPNITLPEDKHIYIDDILEGNAHGMNCKDGKAKTIIAEYAKQSINNITGYVGFGSTGAYESVCVASRGRNPKNTSDRTVGADTMQRFEARTDGKTNCLTTVQKDNYIATPCCAVYKRSEDAKKCRKQYEAHEIHHGYHELHEVYPGGDRKTNTISTVLKDNMIIEPCAEMKAQCRNVFMVVNGWTTVFGRTYQIKLEDGCYIFRKLTPIECERLQTLPDDYTNCVANTHRYRQCGNGWTVDVIAHILKGLADKGDEVK